MRARWRFARVLMLATMVVGGSAGMVRAASAPTLTVSPAKADRGEDGAGRVRKSAAAHALSVTSDAGWIVRALDPVLHIGELHFHHYTHVDRRTLRFVVDDVSRLEEGETVYVQYGEDERSRVRLADLEKTW